jgi:hypothetical protein
MNQMGTLEHTHTVPLTPGNDTCLAWHQVQITYGVGNHLDLTGDQIKDFVTVRMNLTAMECIIIHLHNTHGVAINAIGWRWDDFPARNTVIRVDCPGSVDRSESEQGMPSVSLHAEHAGWEIPYTAP